jgi:general secretion pathway protein K
LTVLWIGAALAAIGFALANTVRGETERASTSLDELRSYYLAIGALDKAAAEVLWSISGGGERRIPKGVAGVDYQFPTGMAHVEIIPETARLDVNSVPPDRLARMLAWMGVEPDRIREIVESVLAWRTGQGRSFSSIQGPTFPGRNTSFQEIEELLAVRGITPEIFYGTYVPADQPAPGQPRLIRRTGLIDCLSVYGSKGQVDAGTADPAVLYALGMPEEGIRALVALRSAGPLDQARLSMIAPLLGAAGPLLRLEGNSIVNIRATGRVRLSNGQLSDLKRTVSATVKFMPYGYDAPIHILRWYDTAWVN